MKIKYYNSQKTPKTLFKESQLDAFYNVIEGLLPGAEEVMEVINNVWDPTATEHSWTMPDGHIVIVPVVEAHNVVYQDPDLGDIPFTYHAKTASSNFRSLCPNVIHSIDAYIAREMVRRCDFQLAHIHDCFLFHPNHMREVSQTYREIMAEIAQMDLLQHILQEISGNDSLIYQKSSDTLHLDILQSEYMLS